MNIRQIWLLFTDRMGNSPIHPQFIAKRICLQAANEAKKYAKGRLIDIGCGTMPYRKMIEPQVDEYIGLDHPKISRSYSVDLKPEMLGDATAIPSEDGKFDTVLMFEVLEHIEEPQKALNEAYRVLSKNGHMILSVPFMYPVHDAPYDFFRYTEFSLRAMFKKSGFQIIKLVPLGTFSEFWLQSMIVSLFFNMRNSIQKKINFFSLGYITLLTLISVPLVLLANGLVLALDLFKNNSLEKMNYFPLNYVVVAKK